MSFLYPFFFILLILPLFLIFFRKKHKFVSLERVFSKEILKKLLVGVNSNKYRFYIGIFSLIFMIIAMARPVLKDNQKENFYTKESFNLVILLDISKSMEATDVFPNRLEFAKKALFELIDKLKGAKIATIAFTHDAFLVNPFSEDFDSIKFLINNLNSNSLSTKGSEITSALRATKRVFNSIKDEKKAVLLVSDGADGREVEKIEDFVKNENIVLHVLNIGTKKGITLKGKNGFLKDKKGNIVISKRDDSISKISLNSGGAFLALSGKIDKLNWLAKSIKKSAVSNKTKEASRDNFKELFYYPLGVALAGLFFLFNTVRLPFVATFVLLHIATPMNAGVFDFFHKFEAFKSYEKGDFKTAQKEFSKIDKDEAIYNKANAFYKQKKFEEALNEYKKIKNFKGENELKRLYNLGNTYAKLNKIDKAIQSYEKALKIKDDEDTKYNLEILKKKKKKNQNRQNKQNKNSKQKNKKDKNSKQKKDKNKKNNSKKEKNKSKKKGSKKQEKTLKKEKKISEAEAKKWEKIMRKKDFKTRPVPMIRGDENEIDW